MRSRSRSPTNLPVSLLICIPPTYVSNFSSPDTQKRIKTESSIDSIQLDMNPSDPILRLTSSKISTKLHALSLVLDEYLIITSNDISSLTLSILVPEPSISIVIGKNGSQIKKLQEKSFTDIKVIDRSPGSLYREIEIKGRPIDIETAVKNILILVKDYSTPSVESKICFKSKIKFIISSENDKRLFTVEFKQKLESQKMVNITCKLIESDLIVTISGKKDDCKDASWSFLSTLCEQNEEKISTTMLLIPSFAIVKIIGPRGSLIKEISHNSGGARIIILGDKNTTKDQKSTRIVIDGNFESKKSAINALFDLIDDVRKEKSYQWKEPEQRFTLGAMVPDRLVSKLIGKKGENVKRMMDQSECSIAFLESTKGLTTPEGDKGRLVALKGNSTVISNAIKTILEEIIKIDN